MKHFFKFIFLSYICLFYLNSLYSSTDLTQLEQLKLHCPILITESDLPLTINEPGNYMACDNLTFNPTASGETAITIASNFVTIDLNKKSLLQGNTITNTNAIKIDANYHNIFIKNGTIAGFTGSTSTNNAYIYAEDANYFITLDSLNFFGHTTPTLDGNGKAIWFNTTYDSIIKNCKITYFRPSSADLFNNIIFLYNAKNISLIDSSIDSSNSLSGTQFFNGVYIKNTASCIINNFSSNNNKIFSPLDASIISVNSSSNVSINNFSCNNNTANTGSLSIVNLNTTNGCSVQNSTIAYNQAPSVGRNFYGIYQENSNSTLIQNCTINQNTSDANATGIYELNCSGNLINNCRINYITASTSATGIHLKNCESPAISSCISGYNTNIGINIGSGCTNPVINDTYVYNNTDFGIYNNSATAVITNCTTNGNGSNFASATDLQAKTILPRNNIEYGYSGPGSDAFDKKDGIIYIPAYAIGNTGLTITEPGHYIFTEPINFDGAIASTAITINANYVTLDLNNFAIENTNSNTNVNAIVLSEGVHDIVIHNGSISNFSGNSIFINQNCYNIALQDLSIIGKSTIPSVSAINCNGTNNNIIYNVTIQNCSAINFYRPDNAIIRLSYTDIVTCNNCLFNYNTLRTSVPGQSTIEFENCNKIECINCRCNSNNAFSQQQIVFLNNCSSTVLDNCTFNNNSINGQGNIININNCLSTDLNNCFLQYNVIEPDLTAESSCIHVNTGSGAQINNCTLLSNNAAIGSSPSSLFFSAIHLESTTACSVSNSLLQNVWRASVTNELVIGIFVENSIACKLVHNELNYINNIENPSLAYGICIYDGNYNIIQNCTVLTSSGTGIWNNSTTAGAWGNESFHNATNFGGTQPPSGNSLNLLGTNASIEKYENVNT